MQSVADVAGFETGSAADSFFAALPGDWDGQAIETPIGPVAYPIHFHLCDQDTVAGVAELSVSDHHWRFWRSGDELRLTFLSTFRGNQAPTELRVSRVEEDTIWFHAPDLELLTLSVSMQDTIMDIRVLHYHKPHVHIRLARSVTARNRDRIAKDKLKSCKRLAIE